MLVFASKMWCLALNCEYLTKRAVGFPYYCVACLQTTVELKIISSVLLLTLAENVWMCPEKLNCLFVCHSSISQKVSR